MKNNKITITKESNNLAEEHIKRLVEISYFYFPDENDISEIIHKHIKEADTILLAWEEGIIIGPVIIIVVDNRRIIKIEEQD